MIGHSKTTESFISSIDDYPGTMYASFPFIIDLIRLIEPGE